MIDKHDELYKDYEAVRKISIVPEMLDVICRLTGLGFAAVARVTENRWLACTVKDEVSFGLGAGDELKIETTICNEIRDSREAVVIDHVAEDELYRHHHTPKTYGLQSYISFPIILKTGEFFGTLCAIGTSPAVLKDPKVTGTFRLFADLLSFHLQNMELVEKSFDALQDTKLKLSHSADENRHYREISEHNLQEQARKIAVFSDILLNNTDHKDTVKVKETASKINTSATILNNMIGHINTFSELHTSNEALAMVNLNSVLAEVLHELQSQEKTKGVSVTHAILPALPALEKQIQRLFSQLITYMVHSFEKGQQSAITVSVKEIPKEEVYATLPLDKTVNYVAILFSCKNPSIKKYHAENIFDIIVHSGNAGNAGPYEAGLAECRRIVQNHGGFINATIVEDETLVFKVVLPLEKA